MSRYTFTRDVTIEERAMNHAFPVLTLNARWAHSPDDLLSSYVHEQLRWYLRDHDRQQKEAIAELRRMYPGAPVGLPAHGTVPGIGQPTASLATRRWRKIRAMARSVKIDTPIPSLKEFGEELGLSRSRQRTLAPVFIEQRANGEYAVRREGNPRASQVFSTQKEAVERAREINPNRMILVERVRDSGVPSRDKWRKA